MSQEKFARLEDCGMKSEWSMFKTNGQSLSQRPT